MRDYLKILIAVTVTVFICIIVVNLLFSQSFQLYSTAAAALLSGIIIAFILRKV